MPEVRAVVGEVRRQQVMDIVRGATFVGTVLLAWVSLHPFVDLGNLQLADISTGNETPTYAAFGGLALLTLALAMRDGIRGLASLPTPAFVLFGAWMCLTVALSLDPGTSIRRFALTACVMVVAAALMLLPKSQKALYSIYVPFICTCIYIYQILGTGYTNESEACRRFQWLALASILKRDRFIACAYTIQVYRVAYHT